MNTTLPQPTILRRAARLFAIAAAIACLVAIGGVGQADAKSKAKPAPAKPLYWGAIIGDQLTGEAPPWDMSALDKFEQLTRKQVSLLGFASPFADCYAQPCTYHPFPTLAMQTLRDRGIVPILTWASQSTPSSLSQPAFRLARVAEGDFDAHIRKFATQAAEWEYPFFLRFNPEMNGFWFPWSEGVNGNGPGTYIAAWRHVHRIFQEVGATNATWVWCPNVDFERRLMPLHGLYPGNAYVDWTCLDGFNWGKTHNSAGWKTFNPIFRDSYRRIVKIAPKKPMLIGEIASDDRGGSKAAWIRQMLRTVPARYPKVRGLVWFNEPDQGMHWTLESNGKAVRAFRHGIKRKVFRPAEFSELPPGRVFPPGWPTP